MAWAITRAYHLRELLSAAGAQWDKDRRAWIASDELMLRLDARSPQWCSGWGKAWAEVDKTRISVDADPAALAASLIARASKK